jgi:hypothetical protein
MREPTEIRELLHEYETLPLSHPTRLQNSDV